MRTPYPIQPGNWLDTPVKPGINPFTKVVDGDDHGYRDVTDTDSDEPLVDAEALGLFCTPDYDGVSIYGTAKRVLPGGVKGKKLLLREGMVRGLLLAEVEVKKILGEECCYQLCDGYRPPLRQAAGFTEVMQIVASQMGADWNKLTPVQIVSFGREADRTFSWVRLSKDEVYEAVLAELRGNVEVMDALADSTLGGSIDDAVEDYLIHSVNAKIGLAADRGVKLDGNKNAHSGGGAIDLMLRGMWRGKIRPLAYTPFDFAHPISSTTYLEDDSNFEQYVALARTNAQLNAHLRSLDFDTPDDFTRDDWALLRKANRVLYHSLMSVGGSFYDPGDPTQAGEWWHWQLGLTVYCPRTGQPVYTSPTQLSATYADSGNTCHTLLRVAPGDKRVATRTGNSAYRLVEAAFGHE